MTPVRVEISPDVLRWAITRSQRENRLRDKYPQIDAWERGDRSPTVKQLHDFAKDARVAVGYLYLSQPPEMKFPLPDLRTVENLEISEPSPDLIDTVYICQRRQAWYEDYAMAQGYAQLDFVGSARLDMPPEVVAQKMREALSFDSEVRVAANRSDYLRRFIQQAEEIGVLVMVNGVVGSNTSRKLNPKEFRGFALSDKLAPLVFVNGADAISARIFTLAHELAHIWLGESALSDVDFSTSHPNETWCNRAAAEMLVPLEELLNALGDDPLIESVLPLASRFKVSQSVIQWRLVNAGIISRQAIELDDWIEHEASVASSSSGGNFYRMLARRVGNRFGRAIVASTLEGQTLYRDAFNLLGTNNTSTFNKFAEQLGYQV